jgi:hypothetical protein
MEENPMRRLVTLLCLTALSALLTAGLASASSGVVGSYAAADEGQGGWSGGPLLSNGTVGGGGGVSFSVPLPGGTTVQEIGTVTSGTWTESAGLVTLTLFTTPIQDPLGILAAPFVATVPANAGPVLIGDVLFRVTLKA